MDNVTQEISSTPQEVVQPITVTPTVAPPPEDQNSEHRWLTSFDANSTVAPEPYEIIAVDLEDKGMGVVLLQFEEITDMDALTAFRGVIQAANIDQSGRIRSREQGAGNAMNQLELISKLEDFLDSMLSKRIVVMASDLPSEDLWLDMLLMDSAVMHRYPHFNVNKPKQIEFMFLRTQVFNNQANMTVLQNYASQALTK